MEERTCPRCKEKSDINEKKCSCGYWFSAVDDQGKFDNAPQDLKRGTFIKENKVGAIVFCVLLGLDIIRLLYTTKSVFATIIAIAIDAIVFFLVACVVQIVYDKFTKK